MLVGRESKNNKGELEVEEKQEEEGEHMREKEISEMEEVKDEEKNKKWDTEGVEREETGERRTKSELARERKIEAVPTQVKEAPYPLVPSKKDKERYFAHFLDIFKKLEFIIPFGEAL